MDRGMWVAGVLAVLAADVRSADPPRVIPLAPAERTKCLAVLRVGLTSDEFWPAMHAAEALTLAGESTEVLLALARREGAMREAADDPMRCGLARERIRAGDWTRAKVLFEILDKPGSNGRAHAAECLFKLGAIGNGSELRRAFDQDADGKLKLMAAAALARGGQPRALDVVRRHLTDPDRELRKTAAWVLGQLGGPDDVAPLRAGLKDETDALARAYIVHALALLGDADGRSGLGANLASDAAAVRTYAAEFAGYCRAVEFRDRLVARLDDPVLDVRVRAAQSLVALSRPPGAIGLPKDVGNVRPAP